MPRRRPTWRDRGAVGCSKCRYSGCQACFFEEQEEEIEDEQEEEEEEIEIEDEQEEEEAPFGLLRAQEGRGREEEPVEREAHDAVAHAMMVPEAVGVMLVVDQPPPPWARAAVVSASAAAAANKDLLLGIRPGQQPPETGGSTAASSIITFITTASSTTKTTEITTTKTSARLRAAAAAKETVRDHPPLSRIYTDVPFFHPATNQWSPFTTTTTTRMGVRRTAAVENKVAADEDVRMVESVGGGTPEKGGRDGCTTFARNVVTPEQAGVDDDDEDDDEIEASDNDDDEMEQSSGNNDNDDDDDGDVSVVSLNSTTVYKMNAWGGYIAHEAENSDDEDLCLVRKLLDIRKRHGRLEFLVHWEGGEGDGFKSWEPLKNLNSGCQMEIDRLYANFLARQYNATDGGHYEDKNVDCEKDDDDASLDYEDDRKPAAKKTKKRPTETTRHERQPKGGTNKRRKSQQQPSSSSKTSQRKQKLPGRGVSTDMVAPMQVADGTTVDKSQNNNKKDDQSGGARCFAHILRGDINCCLAARLFGRRLRKSKEMPLSEALPACIEMDGIKLALLGTKVCEGKATRRNLPKVKMQSAYYVVEAGGGFPTISLQHELEKFANFAGIASPNKCAARLELLFTEAGRISGGSSNTKLFRVLENLSPEDFEEIDENNHIGCGFIPRRMLQDFLGTGKVGLMCTSVQVRVLVPRLGLFKGVLQAKNGIDKIQLPSSMRKVGPSVHPNRWDQACLLIRTVFPSTQNQEMSKMLAGEKLSKSATAVLCEKKFSDMFVSVLQEAGVMQQTIDEYRRRIWNNPKAVAHANVIGLCDPTHNSAIPAGHVFVTGVANLPAHVKTVVVSRFPCTSRFDQRTLQLVRTKPSAMRMDDWKELMGRSFGEIIFGNPKAGYVPIPETIADGDLDGDLYIITWYEPFLQQTLKHSSDRRLTIGQDSAVASIVKNQAWLDDTQAFLRNTDFHRDYGCIRGALHNRWETLVKEQQQGGDGGVGDAEAFGQAYKQALEIKKHGGKIYLPVHLWGQLRPALHRFLTSSSTTSA